MAMPTTDKTMPITSEKSDTKPKRKTKAKIAPFTLNQATLEQLAKNRAYDGTTARKALDGQGINTQQQPIEAEYSKPSNTVVVHENTDNQHTKLHPLLEHEIPVELSKRYAIKDHVYYSKNPDAVSYTHLDVYKTQDKLSWHGKCLINIKLLQSRFLLPLGRLVRRPLFYLFT